MLVVTLVHGTWGRGFLFLSEHAPWTIDASPLCMALRERFGSELELRRFPWSGGNSHRAVPERRLIFATIFKTD
jgi:hypothetical protein